jgi:hypothetical protein
MRENSNAPSRNRTRHPSVHMSNIFLITCARQHHYLHARLQLLYIHHLGASPLPPTTSGLSCRKAGIKLRSHVNQYGRPRGVTKDGPCDSRKHPHALLKEYELKAYHVQ